MPFEPPRAAVRIAFVPFCVASLSRSEIDRVFNAHGLALEADANPYSKTNLVDAYCKLFDWRDDQHIQLFQDVVSDVLSLGNGSEQAVRARETFLSVCARNGVAVEKGSLVSSGTPAARTTTRTTPVRKVLFLASSPLDQARLRLDKEVREVREGLKRSTHRDSFDLIPCFAVKISDLRRGLLDHSPQIVHFAGHGDDDGILVEGDNGRAVQVPVDALADLFDLCQTHVECVILNACQSEAQAEAIAEHIPYVIGMSAGIKDQAAIQFAVGFYDALGAGKEIDDAFRFAKNAIALEGIPGARTPILIRRGH
ncbi:MAG TPA: CHAT domain-containing protein [Pirellulales bacterium]|jgi:hypothetical protein|nr:CHAT domain-containing protein [Pirellulales bacterium]